MTFFPFIYIYIFIELFLVNSCFHEEYYVYISILYWNTCLHLPNKCSTFIIIPFVRKTTCQMVWENDRKSFPQFIEMVLSQMPRRKFSTRWARYRKVNAHWRPYVANCLPCNFKYDYVLKIETFEADMR